MTEYIEREAVKTAIRKQFQDLADRVEILTVVNMISTADVRPVVRGRWVGYPECLKYMHAYADDHIVCSVCEECFSILDNDCERFNFCPNCGADMRGDDDV